MMRKWMKKSSSCASSPWKTKGAPWVSQLRAFSFMAGIELEDDAHIDTPSANGSEISTVNPIIV